MSGTKGPSLGFMFANMEATYMSERGELHGEGSQRMKWVGPSIQESPFMGTSICHL